LEERDILQNNGIIAQGFLEKSNVNAVQEMTSLIETNRLVDMYSKVMKSHMDELNAEAITKLAVRA
jgi:flagellar basal-body rod protein FlgG